MLDPALPVKLGVESSQNGIGAVVLQNDQTIEFASCSLDNAQRAYAQIEKELSALQFGLNRFHQYVYGQKVVLETDRLPLLSIKKKGLHDLTPRLQRRRLRTQLYDFDLVHKPGSQMYIADTLSRAHFSDECPVSSANSNRDHNQIHAVTTGILPKKIFRDIFVKSVLEDPSMNILIYSQWLA